MELIELLARDLCLARGEGPDREEGGGFDQVVEYGNQSYDQVEDPKTAKVVAQTAMKTVRQHARYPRWIMYEHHARWLLNAGWSKNL